MKNKILILFGIIILVSSSLLAQNGGYAVKFNGTDGYAVATMNTGNTNSTTTFEMWFTQVSAQAGTQYLGDFRSVSGTNNRRVMPYLNNSIIGIFCAPNTGDDNNAITQSTGITVTQNVWYHIAVTINSSTLKMYVNGKLYVTTSLTDAYALTGTEVLTIASDYTNTTYANIKADEVRIWSSERTAAEIKANMFKELVGNEAGLLSYYKMSNGSGAGLADNQIAGSYGGVLSGGYTWVASGAFADSRQGLDFDGSNDYVDCGNSASVQRNGTQAFTIEAWVKPTGGLWVAVVSKFVHTATNEGYSLEIFSDNKVSLLYGNNWSDWNATTSSTALTAGVWSHIAATYDGTTAKVYINGLLSQSATWTNGVTDSGTPLLLGSRSGTTYYLGQMDEARVWTVARTAAEIRETMCRTLVGNEAGLAAYYRLDQLDGTTTYDLTSNANNGTLTNMDPNTDWITSDAFNTWIGGESAVWSNTGNWSKGAAPTSSNSVGIYKWALGNETTISTSPTVNNLFISSTSSPTLNSAVIVNMNLILEKNLDLNSRVITLGSSANLVEGAGRLYGSLGSITTTRSLSNISALNVAGLGAIITTAANMGSTTITRGHTAQTGNANNSILRYYDVTPTNNAALNATLVFNYNDAELNSLTENNFSLYKSTDGGTSWVDQGGTLSAANNTLTKTAISSFSRWTVGDTSLPIGGPPDTPVATAATAVTTTSFSANWGAATGAAKYYLDVSTSNTFATFVTGYNDLDVGNVVTYSVTGLTPGITYYYRVRAYNASGTSVSSNTITVISSITAPVATAATSVGTVSLTANWNASTGAAGYYLDVATDIGFTAFVATFNNKNVGNVTTYSVTGLSGGTTYYYRVRAFTSSATSSSSNIITTILMPAAPVALEAREETTTSFLANWEVVLSATKYKLDVATDNLFANMILNDYDVGNNLSQLLRDLTSNTFYYYRVRAINPAGTSNNSNIIAAITSAERPILSTIETSSLGYIKKESAVILTDSVTVQSPSNTPIKFAFVYITGNYNKEEDRLIYTSTSGIIGTWDTEIGRLTLAGEASANVYQSLLRTVKFENNSLHPSQVEKIISVTVSNGILNSNTVARSISIATGNISPVIAHLEISTLNYLKGITPLRLQITDSTVVEDSDNMYLYSANVKFASGFISGEDFIDCTNTSLLTGSFNQLTGALAITGKDTPAGYQAFIRDLQYRNSKQALGITSSKTVEFYVNDGLVNSLVSSRSLEVKSPLDTPANLTGGITSNKVELNWTDNSSGEEGFIVERSEGVNSLYLEIARLTGSTTSYSDQNIVNGRKYYYRVAAYSGIIKSDYSNEISVTGIVVGISDQNGVPKNFVVSQNYPNPFNPSTVIVYSLPYECKVRVQIFNSLGQLIDDLVNDTKAAGYYNVRWNAGSFASGIYLCRILAISVEGNYQFVDSKRMILVK